MRKEWRPVYAQVAVVVAVAEVAAAARQVVPSQRCGGEAEAEAEAEPAAVLRELELAAASGVTGVVEAWGVRAAAVRVVVARAAEPVCRADGGHGAEGPRRW
jgi:predicted xylose isomerase-like sugar epimerase